MKLSDTKQNIMAAARFLAQTRGYNGFSFQDIAAVVGIRTASVHHHYPTKAALCLLMMQQYSATFFEGLHAGTDDSRKGMLSHFIAQYRACLAENRVCLGVMFASDMTDLGADVADEVRKFLKANQAWLVRAFRSSGSQLSSAQAHLFLSSVQGAMLTAWANQDHAIFEEATNAALMMFQRPL
jgi:TetR/AcrR family transcriptional repressor of nem operon